MHKIILAGHRGDRKHAPENTMAGYRAAIALGVDMLEVDLHMSRDGVAFMMHDGRVDRCTNGTGFTHEMDWAEIEKLDAGSWFSPAFAGEKIPSLEEFLELVKATPGLWVNWELKDYPKNVGASHAFACCDLLLDGIYRHHLEERSMLNSFSTEVLEYVFKKSGGSIEIHGQGVAPTGRMHGPVTLPIEAYWDWACMYGIHTKLAEPEVFDACKALALRPCVCVPDTLENVRLALERGCEMFTSDDPAECDRLLRELGAR